MNENWIKDWARVKNSSPNRLTHHQQCQQIVSKFDFEFFLDIGPGTVGSEAWSIATLLPECEILGFEPQADREELLRKAEYPGELFREAVSEKNGVIKGFTGHEGGKTDFWLSVPDELLEQDAYIPCELQSITIDEIFKEHDIDTAFIWADIEGAELSMLKGATQALKNKKIVGLNLELNFFEMEGHCTSDEVVEFLEKHDYVPETKVVKSGTHRDYLFLPKEKA